MNIDTIKASFDECSTEEMAHWVHGLYTGRAIEQCSYFELGATIDQLREDALARIKKTQQKASEDLRKPKQKGYELPYPELQNKLKGLRKGELTLLTAGSGIGKSTLAREEAGGVSSHE